MLGQTSTPVNLHELDQHRFAGVVEPYRRELRAHCYRMLGSLHEAEEMVQETFLRAWSRRETYAGHAAPRAWLYRIATNLCIDSLRRRPRRTLPVTRQAASSPEEPIPAAINEPVWLEPYPTIDLAASEETSPEAKYSRKESIRLAFIAALQLLPPFQRAVLILRDVLDWTAEEAAGALDQTVPAVKSALYRARITLAKHRRANHFLYLGAQDTSEIDSNLLERYLHAWETADVEALVALLFNDCTFSMPPTPGWYCGKASVGALVRKTIFSGEARRRWHLLPTGANGQVGFGLYKLNESTGMYEGYGIQVISVIEGQVGDIITFRTPELIESFGLPVVISAAR